MALTVPWTAHADEPVDEGRQSQEQLEFPDTVDRSPTIQVVPVGDVNRDGHKDIATGFHGPVGLGCGNCVTVIPRTPDAVAPVTVGGLPLAGGFVIHVPKLWYSIVDMGDLNGDGRDDLAVAANDRVHVVFSPESGSVDTADLGAQGFTINGLWEGTASGSNSTYGNTGLAAIGDQNGDGVRDLVARDLDDVKVVYTPADPAGKTVNADDLGTGGYTLRTGVDTWHGPHVGSLGDIDGDGREDIAVAATDEPNRTGYAWGVLAAGPGAVIDLRNVARDRRGFEFSRSDIYSITHMVALGDQNDDGKRDIGITDTKGDQRVFRVLYSPALGTRRAISGVELDPSVGFALQPAGDEVYDVGDQNLDGVADLASGMRVIFSDARARAGYKQWAEGNGFRIHPLEQAHPSIVGPVDDTDGDGRPEVVTGSIDQYGDYSTTWTVTSAYDVWYSDSRAPEWWFTIGALNDPAWWIFLDGAFADLEHRFDDWRTVAQVWDPETNRAFDHAGDAAEWNERGRGWDASITLDLDTALDGAPLEDGQEYWFRIGVSRDHRVAWASWLGPFSYKAPPPSEDPPADPPDDPAPPDPSQPAPAEPGQSDTEVPAPAPTDETTRTDIAVSNSGGEAIDGGPGASTGTVHAPTRDGRIFGRSGNDLLLGGPGNDLIDGAGGNDRLYGRPGSDRLIGGTGNDRLFGEQGRDRLNGGTGNDTISARDGERDVINCGAGRDSVTADKKDKVSKNCEKVRRR